MPIDLPITSATVPSPLDCRISNSDWQALVSLLQATFPDDTTIFSKGNTEPSPARRIYPWFRYNSDGSPDKWYVYSMGAWLSLHPDAPGKVIMYEGTEASIPTFDGGEAGAVTAISGPMWEKVTSMNARFPVGPGTLPSTAVIGIGDQGGEEKHPLTLPEITPHSHFVVNASEGSGAPTVSRAVADHSPNSGNAYDLLGAVPADEEADVGPSSTVGGSGSPPAVEGHNTIPPYTAIWFIRKTARTFYRL
jgi:hypothetical protein